jgi:hypothetical protein
MKKTVLSTLILGVFALMTVNSGTVNADTTKVEYSVDSDYTLVIPQSIHLLPDEAVEMSIKTVNRNLKPGQEVEVSLASGLSKDGEIELQRSNSISDVLTSSIKSNGSLIVLSNPVICSFDGYAMDETEVSTIEFGIPKGEKLAGSYNTTLVFEAGYK